MGARCCRLLSRQSAKLFLQSSELGLPTLSPAGERVPFPPVWLKGGTQSLAGNEGTDTVEVHIYLEYTRGKYVLRDVDLVLDVASSTASYMYTITLPLASCPPPSSLHQLKHTK